MTLLPLLTRGQRIQEDTPEGIVNYLWDDFSTYGNIVYESDGFDQELAAYTYMGDMLLAQTRDDFTTYYLQDAIGSTHALTDESGNVIATYDYDAFGELVEETGAVENEFLFTGQQFDELSGLYNLRARFYNPSLGRFNGRDTYPYNFQNPFELNRYVYTANNPVNLTDPSGFSTGLLGYAKRAVSTLNTIRKAGGGIGALAGGAVSGITSALKWPLMLNGSCGTAMRNMALRTSFEIFYLTSITLGATTGFFVGGALGALGPVGALQATLALTGINAVSVGLNSLLNPGSACTQIDAWALIFSLVGLLGGGGSGPTAGSNPALAISYAFSQAVTGGILGGAVADDVAEELSVLLSSSTPEGTVDGEGDDDRNIGENSEVGDAGQDYVRDLLETTDLEFYEQVRIRPRTDGKGPEGGPPDATTGYRDVDFVIKTRRGDWLGVEVKTGGATRNSNQKAWDNYISEWGGYVGKSSEKAPESWRGQNIDPFRTDVWHIERDSIPNIDQLLGD